MVRKLTEELCGLEISKSQVSAFAGDLDEQVGKWRQSSTEHEYRSLIVGALFEKVRHGHEVLSDAGAVV